MTEEAALSRRSFPQSSRGRFEVIMAAFPGGIAIQNNIEQIVGGLIGHFLSQEQVVDDQQIGFGEELGHLFSPFELGSFEEVFEKGVGFPIHDFIAGLDGGMRHRFGDMAFSGSGRSDQQGVVAVSNELAADQFIDFLFGQFRIEAPIEFRQSGSLCETGGLEAGFGKP